MVARIIVLDNDEIIRQLFTLSLTHMGYEALSYDYAKIDLAALQQLQPNLIILDFAYPRGKIGWEFLQALKMEDSTARIPILITTTMLQLPAEIRGYLSARNVQVVRMPFDYYTLLSLVQKTLESVSQTDVLFVSDRSLPILIVEDTAFLAETLATILELEGYQAVTVGNGQLALDALNSGKFSLILLDIQMPVMDGFEFLRAYEQQLHPHTPVVILSAADNIQSQVFPTFVVGTLSKPYEISKLLDSVKVYVPSV